MLTDGYTTKNVLFVVTVGACWLIAVELASKWWGWLN
jgi:hypothetical protein